MSIKVKCPSCATVLSVDEKFAGKKGRCPKCKGEMLIQAQPEESAPPAARPAQAKPSAPARPAAPAAAPAAAKPAGKPVAAKKQPAADGDQKACPKCGKVSVAAAVICVGCGLNFKTGKQLQTEVSELPPEAPEEEAPEEGEAPEA